MPRKTKITAEQAEAYAKMVNQEMQTFYKPSPRNLNEEEMERVAYEVYSRRGLQPNITRHIEKNKDILNSYYTRPISNDTLPTQSTKTPVKQQTTEKLDKKTIAAAAVATPAVAAGIGFKYKYSRLPQEPEILPNEPDIEMQTYTDEVPTEQLIDHPIETTLQQAQETQIDMPEQVLRHRSNITQNPNIMEPMELEEAADILAGGTAAAGTASIGSTSTGGIIGLGALGVGGIAAGIIGTKKAQQIKDQGLTLPGSDYIGPGNPIHIAPARSNADQIAKDHDIAYEQLIQEGKSGKLTEEQFKQKLYSIDNDAITKFGQDDSWHALIGRWGLKFKTHIEKAINKPLYPKQGT